MSANFVNSAPVAESFKGQKILVTGGCGSLGRPLVKALLKLDPQVVRVMDIDETELYEMRHGLKEHSNVRYLLGDVRDAARFDKAMEGIDICFHLAALKHVVSCEYDPFEAVKTNVLGINNLVEIATKHGVKKVIYTSSDKAANPSSTMGATKLLGEKIIASANFSTGKYSTLFSAVRFGNVVGTRGSVVPLWVQQIGQGGPITITDPGMTRFMMSLKQAVELVLKCTHLTKGGEVFILKMPTLRLGDLWEVVQSIYDPNMTVPVRTIGRMAGEKAYEELISEADCPHVVELDDMFVLLPLVAEHFEVHVKDFMRQRFRAYPELKNNRRIHHRSDNHAPVSKGDILRLLQDSEIHGR